MHLSADRKRAYAISIPRDSIVDRPDCGEDDEIAGGTDVMWNAAYAAGGAACTMRQLEATTGIFIDHYVVVDFNGFKDMVDAVGGVPVCIPEDIDDPGHDIFIKAGDPNMLRATRPSTTSAPATTAPRSRTSAASSASRPSSPRWSTR